MAFDFSFVVFTKIVNLIKLLNLHIVIFAENMCCDHSSVLISKLEYFLSNLS